MRAPQSTLHYVHVRRELVDAKAPLETILEDIEAKVRAHGGIVLSNGQFLRSPIASEWVVSTHFDDWTSCDIEQVAREWGDLQRSYFGKLWGLSEPYQYAAEPKQYDQFGISVRDPTPYLVEGETILALVETVGEPCVVDCPCHQPELVYTSRQRVLCMGCGQLYCVLAESIIGDFALGITNDRWESAFDKDGELIDDDLIVPILDFREVERAHQIWSTDVWDEVADVINLYASGDAEGIARYERGFPKADDLIAAGFEPVPTPPSIAHQLAGDGFNIDILKNSGAALKQAAMWFARSRTEPEALRESVLSTFQATELILKMRLSQFDPKAAKANNPTVLERLLNANVAIDADEQAVIAELRRLRNKLQHSGTALGYRSTRRLLRATFVFLDRFAIDELDYWIGYVCDQEGWSVLLQLPSIQRNANRISHLIATRARTDDTVGVARCGACDRETVVMINDIVGHCLYCRWEPRANSVD